MYSFTRNLIGPKLARMLIQLSVVVRTTISTLRPSTPSLYWMPNDGIQSAASLNWKPAWVRAKAASRINDRTHVASAVPRAVRRIRSRFREGRAAISTAPRSGRKVIRLRIGRPNIVAPSYLAAITR